jgi:hypothetical protein
MDPFTVATGVLGLLGVTIQVSQIVNNYIDGVNIVSVNYAFRLSGPVTALTARRVWHGVGAGPSPRKFTSTLTRLDKKPHLTVLTAQHYDCPSLHREHHAEPPQAI